MITILVTTVCTTAVLGVVFWTLSRVSTPRYRVGRDNIITLIQLVVDGTATEHDWQVFTAIPIRHDPYLEEIRQRCIAIEERYYIGTGVSPQGVFFSAQGVQQLLGIQRELMNVET